MVLGAALACASPAAAQVATGGFEFVEAVKNGDGGKLQELLSRYPAGIVDSRADDGSTGLILAVAREDEDFTAFLLNKGANPNLATKSGDTALMAAARTGFAQGAEWLLSQGAKVDAVNRQGETALIVAVQSRQPALVKLLLDAGADPDRTDAAAGYSARDYATRDSRSRELLKLIEAKKPKAR